MITQVRNCPTCGGQFFQTQAGGRPQVYCSTKCRLKAYDKKRFERETPAFCTMCRRHMAPGSGNRPRVYCSSACRTEAWRQRHAVVEITCDWCGITVRRSPTGITHAAKNHFCTQACKGKWMSENNRGEKHPNWKGNDAMELIYRALKGTSRWTRWQQEVFTNASHSCERCQKPAQEAHHKRAVAELLSLLFDPANGEALCQSCHASHHS